MDETIIEQNNKNGTVIHLLKIVEIQGCFEVAATSRQRLRSQDEGGRSSQEGQDRLTHMRARAHTLTHMLM